MRTKVKRGEPTFTLKLNRLELLHIEAAVDSFGRVDDPEQWLGMYEGEYDEDVVQELYQQLDNLRDAVITGDIT